MKNIKFLSLLSFLVLTFSCVDRDYDFPDLTQECFPNESASRLRLSTNTIFGQSNTVATLFQNTSAPNTPEEFGIVEGYVVSSDLGGNFFKSLSVVEFNEDTQQIVRGFNIPIDATNEALVRRYEPGRKVTIELKGLYKGIDNDALNIGELFENNRIGRISNETYAKIVKRNCEVKSEEDLVITGQTIQEAINNNNLHKLIEFDNVQFKESSLGLRLFEPNSTLNAGSATNHTIEDSQGNNVILRISEFTNFGNQFVSEKSGKIRGVLTKFGSTFQFMVRTINDIKLTENRFTFDAFPPKGGAAITYTGAFSENFESYTTGATSEDFPKYINDPVVGSRYWRVASFGGNKYIQLSSFGGTPESNRTMFIVPIDFTAANTFSFKTKAGFANGNVLKVYYSSNYTPLGNVNNATLVDITSSFTISPGQASGYPANFTNSGNWAIPVSLTGNGFILFEYIGNGNGGPTTTMQIDDIVVN